ncbi:MAG: guanitoxin biosynthesis heme-dependent pre-guanitoxin N-hydroxylase GntA [Candidatus Kapaibacteriales bacterium]
MSNRLLEAGKVFNNRTDVDNVLKSFVIEQGHPCIMAASVVKNDAFKIKDYFELATYKTSYQLISDLSEFTAIKSHKGIYKSFMAVFSSTEIKDELQFEDFLWKQLKMINDLDKEPWDNRVSDNPEDNDFSFSISGEAYYVVGMHPKSSRLARRFEYPALVFNRHSQFEHLREKGKFEQIRNSIRERDISLQGSINPMLKNFGKESEAIQYSGRKVTGEWKCPFHSQNNAVS